MAYQVKRSARITEDLELVDENGEVRQIVRVDLDPDVIVENVSKKYVALLELKRKLPEIQKGLKGGEADKVYEELGRAYFDLMEAVFGAENTVRIAEFYDGRVMEMVKELSPFLFDVVIPKLRKAAQKNRKSKVIAFGLRGF